jgi:hypothetical protein
MRGIIYKLSCPLLLLATAASGQAINVVVLNAKNGAAMRNVEVWVQFYEPPANRELKRIHLHTGADGTAQVQLAEPPPLKLALSASASRFFENSVLAATADVEKQGTFCRCYRSAKGPARAAKPGEVVFLMCRIPWWVRLLAPLERE